MSLKDKDTMEYGLASTMREVLAVDRTDPITLGGGLFYCMMACLCSGMPGILAGIIWKLPVSA